MCGIAGFFGRNNFLLPAEKKLVDMLASIQHRGPDGSGIKVFPEAGLGHVRLAIIDLKTGDQPMQSPDGRFTISYNGELYNFKDVREKLLKNGHKFATESDTEVILYACQSFDQEILNSFRGMFAFALWDQVQQKGLLVRDRFGIKPLFYTEQDGVVLFGSEIKAILAVLPEKPTVDFEALHLLMNFRYIPGNRTLFAGIKHVPPGHVLEWKNNHYTLRRWSVPVRGKVWPARSYVSEGRELFARAVERQLISDVPLGGYLSGGLDSASILAAALRTGIMKLNFPTFTINTGDSPFEARNAKETARFFRVRNFQEDTHGSLEENLPWLIHHLEVPKVNAWQSGAVARIAARHVKVALSGLGGDEVFVGYNMHKIMHLVDKATRFLPAALINVIGWAGNSMCSSLGMSFDEWRRGASMLMAVPDFSQVYGIIRNVWDNDAARKKIYGPAMTCHDFENVFDMLRLQWLGDMQPVEAALRFELEQKMVNDLLLQEDRLSMAYGLEVRVPFLDEDLVDFTRSLSPAVLMQKGRLKSFMKEVIREYLPEEILGRPKSGFQVPVHRIVDQQLKPLARTYLNDRKIDDYGLFNASFIKRVLAARPSKSMRWHYFMIYLMAGVHCWFEHFILGEPSP